MSIYGTSEMYFISAMMILIFIICGAAVYFFAKTYKKEMNDKKNREAKKEAIQNSKSEIQNQNVSS